MRRSDRDLEDLTSRREIDRVRRDQMPRRESAGTRSLDDAITAAFEA